MDGLIFYCKNWGSGICKPEVNKYYPKELTEPGEEVPEFPRPERQKRLDEICRECEHRFFEVEDRKCPVCGSTEIVGISVFDFTDEKIKKLKIKPEECKNCGTRLQPK